MAKQDILKMRQDEIRRYHIVRQVMEGKLGQAEATELAGICERQLRRVLRRVEREGEVGVIHRSRGRVSNRRYSAAFKRQVLGLYRRQYEDFGPTLACEKLMERDGIEISVQTLRNWLIEGGEWEVRRRRRRFRSWRERKGRRCATIEPWLTTRNCSRSPARWRLRRSSSTSVSGGRSVSAALTAIFTIGGSDIDPRRHPKESPRRSSPSQGGPPRTIQGDVPVSPRRTPQRPDISKCGKTGHF